MEIKNSVAEHPDLDWSQVRETVRMLSLAVAQIEMAMNESDDSISTLTGNFEEMVKSIQVIASQTQDFDSHDAAPAKQAINAQCETLGSTVNHSLVAFQFYDKLSQRLDHVNHSLNSLAELVSNPDRVYNPREWTSLQQAIRGRYTMLEEQQMFDALLSGASVEEALEICREKVNEAASGKIEFF